MPQPTKTFRVFVSSTFTDFRVERRILQEKVFPKLKALCESKGATFQDVDLRWGVNEDAQLNQKTMDICLGEIARCQQLSPKPNFIILLGNKYGWQPVPARIPSSEIRLIKERTTETETIILSQWYREDLNAVPPVYVLQHRKGEYQSYEHWLPIEEALREILRRAVAQLPLTEVQRVKYFASATHQEILAGVLNPPPGAPNPEEHVFAYLRTIQDFPQDLRAKDFIDLSGNTVDLYSKGQLEVLRKELANKLPSEHIHYYGAHWNDGCIIDDAKAFGDRVYNDMKSIIETQLLEIEEVDPLKREIKQQVEFKQQRLEHFTGRQEDLGAIKNYLNSDADKAFSIIGASGTGKTSLMAKAIEQASLRKGVIVFRFSGTTSATSDTYRMISGIIREITISYGAEMNSLLKEEEDETRFSTLKGLKEIFPRSLELATQEKPLFIFLDALDQLSHDYQTLILDWIPPEVSGNVRIVLSALPELKDKLNHTIIYDLGAMSDDDGAALLDRWLASAGRTLQFGQKNEVLSNFSSNGTPLYLKLAFEKARMWRSYSEDIVLRSNIDGVLDEFFDGLEKDHGPLLVHKLCGYLLSGKYQGLMEQEILDLLVFDREFWQDFVNQCHPAHKTEVQQMGKLPIVVWSRLFLDLKKYFTEREADGLPIISFYHRKFSYHLRQRYLSSPLPYHSKLTDYFEKKPLYLDAKEETPHIRKVAEQPYQQIMAGHWGDLADKSLADFPFLMAKTKADMVEGIMEDYAFLRDRAPDTVTMTKKLDLYRAFFTERVHILRRGYSEWPAYKILLQLAVEHSDDSPITTSAEKWLEEGSCDWPWLRRNLRLPHAQISQCLAVLEGHTWEVIGALETRDGQFLSWSIDRTLRLWDRDGRPLAVIKGHTGGVIGAFETRDGRFLSWSDDRTLRLWDKNGRTIAVLEGHTLGVKGAFEARDGRFLSWSDDNTLRLWDRDGRPLAVLEGHTNLGWINGALETRDGRLLSWADDRTLRLWDKNGRTIAVLEGHTYDVFGAFETRDGRFLSWSHDNTLRLWDREGRPLTVLEGHTNGVHGAFETRDSQFFSWSGDHTARLWDREGRPLGVLDGHSGYVIGALETKDGRFLSWSSDNTLRLWNSWGSPLAILEGHTHRVIGALETKDGRFLSWSPDRTLRLWDREGKPLAVLEGHTVILYGGVEGAIETRDGRFLSWSAGITIRLWDNEDRPFTKPEGHTDKIFGILETKDGRFLSWSNDQTLRLWDSEGRPLVVLEGHTDWVYQAMEMKDGRFLSWSFKTFRFWDGDGRPLVALEGYFNWPYGALEIKDGRFLSRAKDNTLRIWNIEGRLLSILKGHTDEIQGARVTSDGRIISWSSDNTLRLWDSWGSPLAILEGHTHMVIGALETRDGRFLSWSADRTLRLWDGEGLPLAVLEGHTEMAGNTNVLGAIETSDNRFLSWSNDNTLRLWDRDGKPLAILEGHKIYILSVLETNDGRFLSWGYDKTLRLWDREGRPLAILEGHTGIVYQAIEMKNGQFLSEGDNTFRLWDTNGKPLGSLSYDDCLQSFPEYRLAKLGKNINLSNNYFYSFTNIGCLTTITDKKQAAAVKIFWHGESECNAWHLKQDGLAVLTQANGQVCFLNLYHGNRRISINELEELYRIGKKTMNRSKKTYELHNDDQRQQLSKFMEYAMSNKRAY